MKKLFSLILFCLLLLPGVGRGQGIYINDEGYFLSNGYDSLFRLNKVSVIEIFNQSNTLVYQLFFKHNGRIKKVILPGGENVVFFQYKNSKNDSAPIKKTGYSYLTGEKINQLNDTNYLPEQLMYSAKEHQTASKYKRSYKPNKTYLVKKSKNQKTKTYIPILDRMEIVKPMKYCGLGIPNERSRRIYTKNIKGLPDSLIELNYFVAKAHSENGFKDSEMKISSKTTEKHVLYTFHYEYFDE